MMLTDDLKSKPLTELIDFIEDNLHKEIETLIIRLRDQSEKVERVHRSDKDCPTGVKEALADLWAGLKFHMQSEEQMLFPMIRQGQFATMIDPQALIENQQIQHSSLLHQVKEINARMILPSHACRTWTALYGGLHKLEQELANHFKVEEEILFPPTLKFQESRLK